MKAPNARDLRRLRTIVELRHVQKSSAEQELGRANADLEKLRQEQLLLHAAQDEEQAQWARSVRSGGVELSMTTAWSLAVSRSQQNLQQKGEDVDLADKTCLARRQDLRRAGARAKAAEELTRIAARSARRAAEEAVRLEIEARFASRWMAR